MLLFLVPAVITAPGVLGVVGLAGGLGAAYVYFTGAKNKGLLELYKEEAEAQKIRGDRLELEVGAMKGRMASLEAANTVLGQTVSGSAAIQELEDQLRTQHAEMMALFTSFLHRQAEIMEKGF